MKQIAETEQKIQRQQKRLDKLKAEKKRIEAREKEKERKRDVRRKIIIGEATLSLVKQDPSLRQRVFAFLDESLRNEDRQIFPELNRVDQSDPGNADVNDPEDPFFAD